VTVRKDEPWSLAGAARFAREARISTVRYLRDAPIARVWELGKLQSAYAYHLAHLRDPDVAWAQLFGGMGYRAPYPAGWEQAAGTWPELTCTC
jgi:hypothetical protein